MSQPLPAPGSVAANLDANVNATRLPVFAAASTPLPAQANSLLPTPVVVVATAAMSDSPPPYQAAGNGSGSGAASLYPSPARPGSLQARFVSPDIAEAASADSPSSPRMPADGRGLPALSSGTLLPLDANGRELSMESLVANDRNRMFKYVTLSKVQKMGDYRGTDGQIYVGVVPQFKGIEGDPLANPQRTDGDKAMRTVLELSELGKMYYKQEANGDITELSYDEQYAALYKSAFSLDSGYQLIGMDKQGEGFAAHRALAAHVHSWGAAIKADAKSVLGLFDAINAECAGSKVKKYTLGLLLKFFVVIGALLKQVLFDLPVRLVALVVEFLKRLGIPLVVIGGLVAALVLCPPLLVGVLAKTAFVVAGAKITVGAVVGTTLGAVAIGALVGIGAHYGISKIAQDVVDATYGTDAAIQAFIGGRVMTQADRNRLLKIMKARSEQQKAMDKVEARIEAAKEAAAKKAEAAAAKARASAVAAGASSVPPTLAIGPGAGTSTDAGNAAAAAAAAPEPMPADQYRPVEAV
jgi:hypothetical protein